MNSTVIFGEVKFIEIWPKKKMEKVVFAE